MVLAACDQKIGQYMSQFMLVTRATPSQPQTDKVCGCLFFKKNCTLAFFGQKITGMT